MAGRYVPERGEIVWLDFEPTRGKEIAKYRPALVLSSRDYNRLTGLLICCPVSTSIRGAATKSPSTISISHAWWPPISSTHSTGKAER